MAATLQAQWFGGNASLPAGVNAETGCKWSLDDAQSGTTPVAIPGAAGTNYSYYKYLGLAVTATSTTTISNRNIALSATPTTGLFLWFQAVASGSYAQPSAGNKPTDNTSSNGATPSGYTLLTTTKAVYDSASVASSGSGLNGKLAAIVAGVDNTYTGGAGSALSLGSIYLYYDEA